MRSFCTWHGPSCCAHAELYTSASRRGQDGRHETGMCVPEIGQSPLGFTAAPVPCCQHTCLSCLRASREACLSPSPHGALSYSRLPAVKRSPLNLAQKQEESPPADRPVFLPLKAMWPLPLACLCGLHRVPASWLPGLPQARVPDEPALDLSTRCQLWLVLHDFSARLPIAN